MTRSWHASKRRDVTQAGLDELGLGDIAAAKVQTLDSVDHIADIERVGAAYADRHLALAHLGLFVRQ